MSIIFIFQWRWCYWCEVFIYVGKNALRTLRSWYKSRGLCAQCPKFFNIYFLRYVNSKTTHYEMKNDARKRKPVCMVVDPEWTWNLDLKVYKEEWVWQTLMLECWTFPRKACLITMFACWVVCAQIVYANNNVYDDHLFFLGECKTWVTEVNHTSADMTNYL